VQKPTFSENGIVHAAPFELPPSNLMSDAGAAMLRARAKMQSGGPARDAEIDVVRAEIEQQLAPIVAAMRDRYPVGVREYRRGPRR
jgi:hypothetical protein